MVQAALLGHYDLADTTAMHMCVNHGERRSRQLWKTPGGELQDGPLGFGSK